MILLLKSFIHAHYRKENGKTVFVRDHNDTRSKQSPQDPVPAPSGRDAFGMIQGEVARAAGLPPGPIKLLQGKQIADHKGFGKEHIREQHGDEIRKAGYKSEEEFVADVVKNFNAIYKVGDNRFALVADGKQQRIHIVELSRDKQFYNVITGYVAERSDFHRRNFKCLWKRLAKALEAIKFCCRRMG